MSTLPSGLPVAVAPDEELCRFIFSSRHVKGDKVLTPAFEPNRRRDDPASRYETSVFRADTMSDADLLEAGGNAVAGRTFHGVGLVAASVVTQAGLMTEACEPPPKHAAIRAWASDEGENGKAARKQAQAIIAAHARYRKREEFAQTP